MLTPSRGFHLAPINTIIAFHLCPHRPQKFTKLFRLGTRLAVAKPDWPQSSNSIYHTGFLCDIIEYGSTLYVGMAQKNGCPIKRVQNLMFRTLLWM